MALLGEWCCASLANDYLLVRLAEKRLQTKQNSLYVVYCAPFVLEDIQADPAREVDIGMINGSLKEDGRRRVWIAVGKREGEFQVQVLVRSLGRTGDGCSPREEVSVGIGESGDARRRRKHELHQFSLQSKRCKRRGQHYLG